MKRNKKTKKRHKILIVGGAGYIGGHMTDLLVQKKYDVTVYDALIFEGRFMKDVPFIYGDVRDKNALSKIINDFDIVIWLAAIVGDEACSLDPELTREINLTSVKWLVRNFKGKIIYTSTCSVYGANQIDSILDEKSGTNPLSIYASTKLDAEKIISKKAKNALIFRLGTLFGVSDVHTRMRFDLVVNVLTKKATLGEPLSVFGGGQWRPLLHVKDVAEAVLFGIEKDVKGLYNIAYENYRIKDIAHEIKKLLPGIDVDFHNIKFEDLRNYRVNFNKFRQLGWKPKYTLEHGILEVHQLIKEKRMKDPSDIYYSNAAYLKKRLRTLFKNKKK